MRRLCGAAITATSAPARSLARKHGDGRMPAPKPMARRFLERQGYPKVTIWRVDQITSSVAWIAFVDKGHAKTLIAVGSDPADWRALREYEGWPVPYANDPTLRSAA